MPQHFSIGTRFDEPSYIHICGEIIHHNIPEPLNRVLSRLRACDIRFVSIGPFEQFYLEYVDERRSIHAVTSDNVLDDLNLSDPSDILYLELGSGGDYFCIKQQLEEPKTIWNVANDKLDSIIRDSDARSLAQDLKYLSLGPRSSWIYGTKNETRWNALHPSLLSVLQRAQVQGLSVERVALCPTRPDRWWIGFSDGSTQQQLVDMPPNRPPGILPALPPSAQLPPITALSTKDPRHTKISQLFYSGWHHPSKPMPVIRDILVVAPPSIFKDAYHAYREALKVRYKSGGRRTQAYSAEKLAFHGTRRQCTLGDDNLATRPCLDISCCLCSILLSSFRASKAGTDPQRNFLRFGPGIYTTVVSSKADDYSKNGPNVSGTLKVLIVASVLLGKSFTARNSMQEIREPPAGYDSVVGEIGETLNYPEDVLYYDYAILPAYIVVYQP